MTLLLQLWITFVKIGAFAFGGGYAILPLIQKYVVFQHQWLSIPQLVDVVAISQMTPGPIAINSATFVGMKVAGLPGALVATSGEVLPQFVLMLGLSRIIFSGKEIKFLDYLLKGLRPAVVGLLLVATLDMMQSSLLIDNHVNGLAVACFGLAFYLHVYRKHSLIQILLTCGLIGLIYALFY